VSHWRDGCSNARMEGVTSGLAAVWTAGVTVEQRWLASRFVSRLSTLPPPRPSQPQSSAVPFIPHSPTPRHLSLGLAPHIRGSLFRGRFPFLSTLFHSFRPLHLSLIFTVVFAPTVFDAKSTTYSSKRWI
jgi:hypothetical protein